MTHHDPNPRLDSTSDRPHRRLTRAIDTAASVEPRWAKAHPMRAFKALAEFKTTMARGAHAERVSEAFRA